MRRGVALTGKLAAAIGLAWILGGCRQAPPQPEIAPFLYVLGTAQDGGIPHAACTCTRCEAARRDSRLRRRVASLAIVLPSSRRVYLVDATPDFPEQLAMVGDWALERTGGVDRSPLEGILLTHAHMGHYLGLAWLGFEAVHVRGLPLYVSAAMAEFLETNEPWARLASSGNVTLHVLEMERPLPLAEGVRVIPFLVPHRAEHTDTLGLRIEGPRRTFLYVPDTDGWENWEPPLEQRLAGVDVAFLDGTFYSTDELPDRDARSIGHPPVVQTMGRLDGLGAARPRVYFTHMNHSNPLLEPESPARRELERRGYGVLEEGRRWPL